MSRAVHPPRFDHHNDIQWRVQITEILLVQFLPASCYLLTLRFHYPPQHSVQLLGRQNTFHTNTKHGKLKEIELGMYFWKTGLLFFYYFFLNIVWTWRVWSSATLEAHRSEYVGLIEAVDVGYPCQLRFHAYKNKLCFERNLRRKESYSARAICR